MHPSEENAGSAAAPYGSCILFPQKSIFDNIALALSSDPGTVPFHRVVEACRAAMLHEFVIDLPEGYDTILGSGGDKEGGSGGGVQLSGGQKQRLMLARQDFGIHLFSSLVRVLLLLLLSLFLT